MAQKIWLRVKLPDKELASIKQEFPNCELRQSDDTGVDPNWLSEVDGVFTEETVPDEIIQRMTDLRWLHVTRGGVNAYLTPSVKTRPIQVTGSKGIHGTVFSEFALGLHFHLGEKASRSYGGASAKEVAKASAHGSRRQTIGIVGLGTVGLELARKAKALGMRVLATKRNPGAQTGLRRRTRRARTFCRN